VRLAHGLPACYPADPAVPGGSKNSQAHAIARAPLVEGPAARRSGGQVEPRLDLAQLLP